MLRIHFSGSDHRTRIVLPIFRFSSSPPFFYSAIAFFFSPSFLSPLLLPLSSFILHLSLSAFHPLSSSSLSPSLFIFLTAFHMVLHHFYPSCVTSSIFLFFCFLLLFSPVLLLLPAIPLPLPPSSCFSPPLSLPFFFSTSLSPFK